MIVLDTNVLSELLRPAPEANVVAWVGHCVRQQLFTTAITEAEIRYGVSRLEDGRRRRSLMLAIDGIFAEDFDGRVLPFDSEAAKCYAKIVSEREKIGLPISQFDAQIAAITLIHGAKLATRNTKDFENCGLSLINPWSGAMEQ